MSVVLAVVYAALAVLKVALLLRLVLDVVSSFEPRWTPRGAVLVGASAVMAVTDPPLRWLRSKIPPISLGGIGLDVAFLVLWLGVTVLSTLVFTLGTR